MKINSGHPIPKQYQLLLLLSCFMFFTGFSQSSRNTAMFLSFEYAHTTYDITKGNNPEGLGFDCQAFFNRRSIFQPVGEISTSLYLLDDKVGRSDNNGIEIESIGSMVNLLVGAAFVPWKYAYISVVAGPSLLDIGQRFVLKPLVGFFFPRNQRFTAKVSYLNIFHRDKETNQDFRSLSFAVGVRLF